MSNTDGTCEYVLDPEDPETWGGEEDDECYVNEEVLNEGGVWTCPHDAEEGESLCVFHLPYNRKDHGRATDEVIEMIESHFGKTNENEKYLLQILGGRFFELNISDYSEDRCDGDIIDLSYSKVRENIRLADLDLKKIKIALRGIEVSGNAVFKNTALKAIDVSGSEFEGRTSFDGMSIEQIANFTRTVFNEPLTIRNANFEGVTSFENSKMKEVASFRNTAFNDNTTFGGVEFGGHAILENLSFDSHTTFNKTVFKDDVNFTNSYFSEEVNFQKIYFGGYSSFPATTFTNVSFLGSEFLDDAIFTGCNFVDADFQGTNFEGEADFSNSEFQDDISFRGAEFYDVADFSNTHFLAKAIFRISEFNCDVTFSMAHFSGNAIFNNSNFEQNVVFRNVEFDSGCEFTETNLHKADFRNSNLTDSTFSRSDLSESNFESSLLSRATLFDTDLRGGKLSGAVLGDVRINENTNFLGHPSDDSNTSPHTLSAIRSQSTCVYDPDYEDNNEHEDVDKAKSVYRALEELGGKHARPRLQARSFVRRQDLQKKDYWDDATADDASFEERLIAGARWSRARVARATLLYGESPWRVIAWSLGIILSFALLYPLGGWMKPTDGNPITYAQIASNPVEILNSVYYSTLTYTALGFGDFQPVGLGRLLTTVETGLGAVMLALLVFILGRRAAR